MATKPLRDDDISKGMLSVHAFWDVEDKIAAARTRLILDKPFLGALVLRLPLQSADASWCPTTGTDARKFYYNTEYITSLKSSELQFVLAHEALHCALSHFSRRQHRVKHRWDLACDYAINPILLDENLKPPPGIQVLSSYHGMTAEEIYPLIDDNDQSETMDQHLYDKQSDKNEGGKDQQDNPLNQQNQKNNDSEGESEQAKKKTGGEQNNQQSTENLSPQTDSQPEKQQDYNPDLSGPLSIPPPSLNETEVAELEESWQQRMAGAAQQAIQSGKMSGNLKRLVETKLNPQLPWRSLLARHLTSSARDDYSWARPSSRRGGSAIFPSLKSSQIDAVIAIDVSGSISDKEIHQYLSEINAIKGHVRASVTLIPCDTQISKNYPLRFETWDEIDFNNEIKGGGATDFCPVFDWVNKQDHTPEVLIYFTDAIGQFPETPPHYPVIWLVKGKRKVPWGERIQLN